VYAGDDGCAVELDTTMQAGIACGRPATGGRAGARERAHLMRWPWQRRPAEPEVLPTPPAQPPPTAAAAPDLSDLEDRARYHRDRLALYRAKMHGPKQTSVARLEELQRAATAADDRLATARRRTGTDG